MKLSYLLGAGALLAFIPMARADMMAPATLDLVCKDKTGKQIVKIVSGKKGSAVTLPNGKTFPGEQLIAGTEGGPAYLQAVDNEGGYNITINGGDLVKAFESRSEIANGEASANVNLFSVNKEFDAKCKGLFSFQK